MKGVNINNLRYANDTVLLAEGPMDLQALLTAVKKYIYAGTVTNIKMVNVRIW